MHGSHSQFMLSAQVRHYVFHLVRCLGELCLSSSAEQGEPTQQQQQQKQQQEDGNVQRRDV